MNTAEFKSATFPNAGPRHLLDDSVMEPHAPSRGQAESSTLSSGISIGERDSLGPPTAAKKEFEQASKNKIT